MGDIKFLPLKINYSTEEELYFKLIKIHNVAEGWNLSDTHIKILTYLLRFGYNENTLKIICKELPLTRGSLKVHLSNLRKGKVGKKKIEKLMDIHKTNNNISIVSTQLKDIKKMIEDDNILMILKITNV